MPIAAAYRLHPGLRTRGTWAAGAVALLAGVAYVAAKDGPALGSAASDQQTLAPLEAPPLLLRKVDPVTAITINRGIPFTKEPNPPARRFATKGDEIAYGRALECLASAIYYEAGNQTPDGQRAVAQVILNRVRHPAFAAGVCGVIFEGSTRDTGCQFSFTCDGSMLRLPDPAGWARAKSVAKAALAGEVFAPVGYATHYHAEYVVPYWATSLAKNAVQGTHIFYRWRGGWGRPRAFARRHLGNELDPRLLRYAALRGKPKPGGGFSLNADALMIGVDSRAELISIVAWLAATRPVDSKLSDYEELVRGHFEPFSHHVAVEIYRQLAAADPTFTVATMIETLMRYSPPPELKARGPIAKEFVAAAGGPKKLEGFMIALREFVKHSDFEAFVRKRQPLYAKLEQEARKPALAVYAGAQSESGVPVDKVRLVLAPLLENVTAGGCQPLAKKAFAPWVLVSTGSGSEKALRPGSKLRTMIGESARDCAGAAVAVNG